MEHNAQMVRPVWGLQYMLSRLAEKHPFLPRLTPDGVFGEKTLEAVMLFQRELLRPVTGVVDRRTWDEISRAWSGMTTRQYKRLKGLKKENLRDNMSDTELVLTMLAEASTRDISKASKPEGFSGSMEVARQGGEVAGVARKALEERTGAPVITAQNAAQMNTLVVGMIEEAAALPAQAEADDKE